MALITARDRLNTISFDGISDWAEPIVTPTFFDNVPLVSVQGRTYEDHVRSTWAPYPDYRNFWAGSGLAWDDVAGALTAGTITGFIEQEFIGGVWVETVALEDFTLDAVVLSNALNSPDIADDVDVIKAIFADADTFNLSDDADSVSGYAGNDTIDAAGGSDFLRGDEGDDSILGGAGVDTVQGGAGSDTVSGGDDGDFLTGDADADTLSGGAGNDFLNGGTGSDVLDGGTGLDRADYRGSGATGAVTVMLGVATPQDTGGAGVDTYASGVEGVIGTAFADSLTGSSGNGVVDLFLGGGGNDTIRGGTISDRVAYTDGNLAEYWISNAGVNVNLKTGVALDGLGGTDTLSDINLVTGGSYADTIVGSDGALFEAFSGLAGNDSFNGGNLAAASARINYDQSPAAVVVNLLAGTAQDGHGGTDTFVNVSAVRGSAFGDTLLGSHSTVRFEFFEGRAGHDRIDGRGGLDEVRYDNASTAVRVNLALGTAVSASDGNDTLIGIESARGSAFGDTLLGSTGDNELDGRAGNDSLAGGAGDDTFVGGAGNDTIVGGTQLALDYLSYAAAASSITANLGLGTVTSATEGNDSVSQIEAVFGGRFADLLTGSAGADYLRGNGANDRLDGGLGTDIADYSQAAAAVVVDLAAGTATGGDGSDTLISIESAYGSSHADTLRGDALGNSLRGRAGNDVLDGRGGFDRADYRSAGGAVTVNLASATTSGADGSDTLISIENARGSESYNDTLVGNAGTNILDGMGGNDSLVGGAANDTLFGDSGNDRLDGGTGNDSMTGGNGNDVYVVDAAGDLTVETTTLATEIDTVQSLVSRTLGANLERLTLTGAGAINGTGNGLANMITGGTGANTLNGLGGNDDLAGGAGNDRLIGDLGNDTLAGGSGNDTLSGGLGNDSLLGAAGLDAFLFDRAPGAAAGVDRLTGFSPADDRVLLENAVFVGVGAAGALAAAAFRAGAAAGDASDRIVYHAATGRIYFDADGTGAAAPILFATVAAGTALTAADFVIV